MTDWADADELPFHGKIILAIHELTTQGIALSDATDLVGDRLHALKSASPDRFTVPLDTLGEGHGERSRRLTTTVGDRHAAADASSARTVTHRLIVRGPS